MIPSFSWRDESWSADVRAALDTVGCVVVHDAVGEDMLSRLRKAMYAAREQIVATLGEERLSSAGEIGVLRLLPALGDEFLELLGAPALVAIADLVSPTSICHLQNGLILPSTETELARAFQTTFHRDFPRLLNGTRVSLNAMLAVTDYTVETGATYVMPASHQRTQASDDYMRRHSLPAECRAGSLVVFDSTLFHAAGHNHSGADRLGINHQFTPGWIKPQIDYSRALGAERVQQLPDRLQQLLGFWTRVPTTLEEFYRPPEGRLYRPGQG